MTREEAIKFFEDHCKWFLQQYGMTMQGVEYHNKIKEAVEALKGEE